MISTDTNIWRVDLWNRAERPAAFIASTREDDSPQYSPDGKRIAFQSDRSGKHEVWVCDADGLDAVQLVDMDYAGSPRWSPDGERIAFDALIDGRWQIFTVSSGGSKPQRMTRSISNDIRPSWSHDGKWIYFGSSRKRRLEIWKMPTSGGDAVQVTKNGGDDQVESEDGRTIFYTKSSNDDTRNRESSLWEIPADGGQEKQVLRSLLSQSYAVTQDGIYYVASAGLQLLSFAGGGARLITKLDKEPSKRMSVSPDGHWLLYGQIDRLGGSDLMLVENFR
jgi:Tol biopolymer transport system component